MGQTWLKQPGAASPMASWRPLSGNRRKIKLVLSSHSPLPSAREPSLMPSIFRAGLPASVNIRPEVCHPGDPGPIRLTGYVSNHPSSVVGWGEQTFSCSPKALLLML